MQRNIDKTKGKTSCQKANLHNKYMQQNTNKTKGKTSSAIGSITRQNAGQ